MVEWLPSLTNNLQEEDQQSYVIRINQSIPSNSTTYKDHSCPNSDIAVCTQISHDRF